MPIMLRINWATRAMTVPASTAPQEILFRAILRRSSAGVTGLMCTLSPRAWLRGVAGLSVTGAAPEVGPVEAAGLLQSECPLAPRVARFRVPRTVSSGVSAWKALGRDGEPEHALLSG